MDITNDQKDTLKELVNIGAGNASTALSQMLNQKVVGEVPTVHYDSAETVINTLCREDSITTAILLKLTGVASGVIILAMDSKNAMKVASMLTGGHAKDMQILDEFDRSALREMGNILTGTMLAAISKFLQIPVMHSLPDVATDMFSSLLSSVIVEVAQSSERILAMNVTLMLAVDRIPVTLFFLFTPEVSDVILKKISTTFDRNG